VSPAYFLVIVCLISVTGFAQTKKAQELPASAHQLISVTVTGSDHYKSEDVMGATGMKPGDVVNQDDLKDAARILGDSGAFTDIAYTFEYSPEGTKIQWKLKDAAHFVPVRFENFVWFTDQQLLDAVHASVRLFHGEVPAQGRMADQVSEALQVLLAEKGLPGNVDYLRVGPDDASPEALAYSVTGPSIAIRNVQFSGAGPEELPLLQSAAENLQGTPYMRSTLRTKAEKMFFPIYLQRGYLKANFGEPQAKVVSNDSNEISVDTTFTVVPGRQYKLQAIELSGERDLSAETLTKVMHATLNQPANAVELNDGVTAIKQLYGTRGHVEASLTCKPEIDDANDTVKYQVHISEGAVYKMGDLEILGLDSLTSSRLQNEWTLHAGDTYDSSYAQRFLNQAYKEIGDWRVRVEETPNEDHTVDVTLRFDSQR
jgi:outer membrane protein assembly factor BamA